MPRALVAAVLALQACVAVGRAPAPVPALRSAEEVGAAVERQRDAYRRVERFIGPQVAVGRDVRWHLERTRPDVGAEELALQVEWRGASWKFLSSAYDIEGRRYELRRVEQSVSSDARVFEHVAVVLPLARVREERDGPLKLRLCGEKSDLDLELPRPHLRGFLAGCGLAP